MASDSNDETATVVDGGEFHLTSNGRLVTSAEVAGDVDDGAADELIKASGWFGRGVEFVCCTYVRKITFFLLMIGWVYARPPFFTSEIIYLTLK